MSKVFKVLIVFFLLGNTCLAVTTAENGQIDLSDIDFSQTQIELNGEWEFYPNTLLHVDQKNISPNIVTVPGLLNKQGFDLNSYGSYRIILKHNYEGKLALKIPDIYTAYSVYINGQLELTKGKVGRSSSESSPRILLNTLRVDDLSKQLEIVIHVSNFEHRKFGINNSIVIGDYNAISRTDTILESFDIFLTGCLLMGGFFFLGLFYYGRKEIAALYFALFCICYSYRIIGWENYVLHELFPEYPWWLSVRIEYITLYMSGFFLCQIRETSIPKRNSNIIC